jgi:hypothetical protein
MHVIYGSMGLWVYGGESCLPVIGVIIRLSMHYQSYSERELWRYNIYI